MAADGVVTPSGPKEYQEQKKFYSGKKKSHTLKN
jgi:hypothetical protein